MKIYSSILLVIVSITSGFAQSDAAEALLPALKWNKGSVVLIDGTELKGNLKYNERAGLLSFESDTEARSFTPRGIVGFEFYDTNVNRHRVFYSFEYEDPFREPTSHPYVFEVLKEFDDFAVLSRFDPMDIRHVTPAVSFTAMPATNIPRSSLDLSETVYILTRDGEIAPYLRLGERMADGGLFDSEKKKKKSVNRVLSEYFAEPGLSRMMDYAERESLNVTEKEDFIKALTYYKQLMTPEKTQVARRSVE